MESSSKRRKVSPGAGISVNASNTELSPANGDTPALTPVRASFMSPTKSSIARYHPSLLPRPKSAGGDQDKEDSIRQTSTPKKLNAVPLRPTTSPERQARLSASPVRAGSASPSRPSIKSAGGSLSAPARRRSRTPGRRSEPTKTQVPVDGAAQAANTQLSQELEATAAEAASKNFNLVGVAQTIQNDGEPGLPPTPEQLGLKPMPSPPRGLMSSSPTARISKRKAKSTKSSPFKPRQEAPVSMVRNRTQVVDETPREQQEPEEESESVEKSSEEIQKRQIIHELTTRLGAIRQDISLLEKAVLTTQVTESALPNPEKLASILTSSNPLHKPMPPPPKALSTSAKIAFFLPFSKRPIPKESSPVSEVLPSYHPIEVGDPVSQLTTFHPLQVSSKEGIVASTIEEERLLRQQDLTIASPGFELRIQLRLIINTVNDSVETLSIETMSPWADQELGTWIKSLAHTGDISTIGWASGRYWNLAQKRAAVWAHCCETYEQLLPNTFVIPREPSSRKDFQAKVKSWSLPSHVYDIANLSRAQLRMHLGRRSLRFSHSGVAVTFRWEIAFDWTGEVQSKVSADLACPGSWRKADGRKSLVRIGDVYRKLVKERGVRDAIRVVVGIVWPET